MSWVHRFRSFWRSEQLNRDLNDELRFHLEMRARENLAQGMNPEDTRRVAERQFRNATLIKDGTRDMNIAQVAVNNTGTSTKTHGSMAFTP